MNIDRITHSLKLGHTQVDNSYNVSWSESLDEPNAKTYVVVSTEGVRKYVADDISHAREQHLDAFPEEGIIKIYELTEVNGK